MHGGQEIDLKCVKYMSEAQVREFVKNTNAAALAESLENDPEDHHHGAYCEIDPGFDKERCAHYVEVRFYMEVEDLHNVQEWCAAEGFEIIESMFGTRI